jgi:hypothetical protein
MFRFVVVLCRLDRYFQGPYRAAADGIAPEDVSQSFPPCLVLAQFKCTLMIFFFLENIVID